jgi:single-strand DNA-binding protein
VIAGTFVIAVSEQRQAALAGCAAQSYTSPPQSLEQARALAGLLLGAPVAGAGPWRHPIAGGQRTVELIAAVDGDRGNRSPQVLGAVDWPRPENPRKGTAVNRYQCTGRLVDDPILKHTTGGKDVCEMRLAVDGMAPGKETGFLNVSQFGPGGVAAANTLTKGWLVGFDGRLEHHTWKDRDSGQSRQAYVGVGNVEFLAAPRGQNGDRATQQTAETGAAVEVDAEADTAPRAQQTPPQARPAVGAAVGAAVSDEMEF